MAKRPKTRRAAKRNVSAPARRTSVPRSLVRRKPRGRRPPVSAAVVADFETLMQSIDDAIVACVRLRQWNDLEAAVTEYAQALDAASLLNGAIFRRVARHAMTVEDPDEFVVWAEHARVGYESPPQQNVAAPGH